METDEVPGKLYNEAVQRHDRLVAEEKLFYEPSEPEIVEYDGFTVQYSSWDG